MVIAFACAAIAVVLGESPKRLFSRVWLCLVRYPVMFSEAKLLALAVAPIMSVGQKLACQRRRARDPL